MGDTGHVKQRDFSEFWGCKPLESFEARMECGNIERALLPAAKGRKNGVESGGG